MLRSRQAEVAEAARVPLAQVEEATEDDLLNVGPTLDLSFDAIEVIRDALADGAWLWVAHLSRNKDRYYYDDEQFGPVIALDKLTYDAELGLCERA